MRMTPSTSEFSKKAELPRAVSARNSALFANKLIMSLRCLLYCLCATCLSGIGKTMPQKQLRGSKRKVLSAKQNSET